MLFAWLDDEHGGWCGVCVVSDNNIGAEGAKALAPHVAKLLLLQTLNFDCACLQLTRDV